MKIILIICFMLVEIAYSQTQYKVEWPSLADSPWPTLRGDMQGTGRSEFVGPKTANVIWRADARLGILFGPVIGYEDKLFFGSLSVDSDLRNHFYAYNPDGTEFWSYETPTGYPNEMSPLAAKDSTIYMLTNELVLYAFTHQGDYKWRTYAGTGSYQLAIDTSGNIYLPVKDTIKVFSSKGVLLNSFHFDSVSSSISFSPDGNRLYFKSGNHQDGPSGYSYLNASDLEGNLIWRYKFERSNYAHAAVDNQGNVYVFGNDSLDNLKKYLFLLQPQVLYDGNILFTFLPKTLHLQ